MSSKSIKELLRILYSRDLKDEEEKLLKRKIKKIITRVIDQNPHLHQSLIKIYGEAYIEDLTQEFFYKLYNIAPHIISKQTLSEAYFVKMAKNLIFYLFAKERVALHSEEISIIGSSNPDDEEQILHLDSVVSANYVNEYFRDFIVESVIHTLKEKLTEKEWETFCFYIMKEEQRENLSLSLKRKNVIYKRWERLKPKLQNLLIPYLEDEADFPSYWQEIVERIRSEICSKFDY